MKFLSLRLRLQRLAKANDAKYLVQINLRTLSQDKPEHIPNPREFYQELQQKAQEGPIFSKSTIDFCEKLDLDLSKDEVQWIANCHKDKQLTYDNAQQLPSVLDYVRAEKPNLKDLGFAEALADSATWHQQFHGKEESAGPYKTNNNILNIGNLCWIDVPLEDLKTEGDLMGHCVGSGGYDKRVKNGKTKIFSLRDTKNEPHVTIEVTNGRLAQVQGKQNKPPVEKYHSAIIALVRHLKLKHNSNSALYATGDDKLLKQFARSDNSLIRNPTVRNHKLPRSAFEELVANKNPNTRSRVAQNPHLPYDLLVKLSKDRNSGVISAVLDRADIPSDLLVNKLYAKSITPPLLLVIARNPNLPVAEMKKLYSVSRGKTELNRKLPAYDRRHIACHLAQNTKLPPELCSLMSRDDRQAVVEKIAYNPQLPAKDAANLSKSVYVGVRETVAASECKKDDATIQKLLKDKDNHVVAAVIRNKSVSREIITKFADSMSVGEIQTCYSTIIIALLHHCDLLSEKFIRSCVRYNDSEGGAAIRIGVAKHSKTPIDLLKDLTEDDNKLVKEAAKRMLSHRKEAA